MCHRPCRKRTMETKMCIMFDQTFSVRSGQVKGLKESGLRDYPLSSSAPPIPPSMILTHCCPKA